MKSDVGYDVVVRTLGDLALTAEAGSPADELTQIVAQPKRLALLLYLLLALPRGFHRRDALLAMFWPDMDRSRGGASLRQALYFLRRALPADLLINRGTEEVGLERNRIGCDAVSFDEALDAGREAEALELYRGDLLPGFNLSGCPDFERWIDMERDRLRRRAARAALVLSYRCAEDEDATGAAEWANAAMRQAPYDEASLREVVLLLDRIRNRPEALRLYEEFAGRLEEDLGIQPSEQTRNLIDDLRSGGVADERDERDGRSDSSRKMESELPPRPTSASAPGPLDSERVSLNAYHTYLRARHQDSQRTPASMQRALEDYRKVVRSEPDFAPAHAGIARALSVLTVYAAYPAAEVFPLVKHHAAKAIDLDPELAEAREWLAFAVVCHEWDWDGAERELNHAIELEPTSAEAHLLYALYLLAPTRRFERAVAEVELARELDPMSQAVNTYVGSVCFFARRYDRAVQELNATLERDADFPLAWWFLGRTFEQTGAIDEAIAAHERAVALTERSSLMLAQLGRVRALAGDRHHAEGVLQELHEREEESGPTPYFSATIHAALGDVQSALDALRIAYRARLPHLVFAAVDPALDGLCSDRHFRELLLRMGLKQEPPG